jgi:hypothetical protein
MPLILEQNPTADGIMSCMEVIFSVLSEEYYYKVLHVLYREQHRNTIVRDFIAKIILETEGYVERIFIVLKSLHVIRHDADPDFWKKATTSLLYAFHNRTILGFGDDSPDFTGRDVKGLLFYMFDAVFKIYGITDNQAIHKIK